MEEPSKLLFSPDLEKRCVADYIHMCSCYSLGQYSLCKFRSIHAANVWGVVIALWNLCKHVVLYHVTQIPLPLYFVVVSLYN